MSYWYASHVISPKEGTDVAKLAKQYMSMPVADHLQAFHDNSSEHPIYTTNRSDHILSVAIQYRVGINTHIIHGKTFKMIVFDAELSDSDAVECKMMTNASPIYRDNPDYELIGYIGAR